MPSRSFRVTTLFFLTLSLLATSSCSQKLVNTFETGKIMKMKLATVEKVTKFTVTRDAMGEGTFAEMASSTANAITPGIIAAGTGKIASATGSLMDSKVERVSKVRVRVKMKDDNELLEIIQNDIPGLTFSVGQAVVITTGDTPGNVWPD